MNVNAGNIYINIEYLCGCIKFAYLELIMLLIYLYFVTLYFLLAKFSLCLNNTKEMKSLTHTHTHTYIYIRNSEDCAIINTNNS